MSALKRPRTTGGEETSERFDPVGNERLTAIVGIVLLVLTVVELATIVFGVHRFMSLHVFVGFVLLPPIVLKLASTGWRFARYYTGTSAYVVRGPPLLPMRVFNRRSDDSLLARRGVRATIFPIEQSFSTLVVWFEGGGRVSAWSLSGAGHVFGFSQTGVDMHGPRDPPGVSISVTDSNVECCEPGLGLARD